MHARHIHQESRTGRAARLSPSRLDHRVGRTGFTLTELLVVIGIIVLLIGLLLVALGKVRKTALRAKTEATMNQFANACSAFQTQHGFYPGVIPDEYLQYADQPFSSTENAMLHLTGGCRVLSPVDPAGGPLEIAYQAYKSAAQANTPSSAREITFTNPSNNQTWKLIVDLRRIGEGPLVNGKAFAPYYTPGTGEAAATTGQVGINGGVDPGIPDLIDAWGQPIVYIKQSRTRGPLLTDPANPTALPQFVVTGALSYMRSTALGELAQNQDTLSIFGNGGNGPLTAQQQNQVMAVILAHQAFYKSTAPLSSQASGAFVLLSAGPDGVYFSRVDGPGSPSNPIMSGNVGGGNDLIISPGPKVINEFDDVRFYGGG